MAFDQLIKAPHAQFGHGIRESTHTGQYQPVRPGGHLRRLLGHLHAPLSLERLAALGVARVSYGPSPQRVALAALQHAARDLHASTGPRAH